MDEPPLARRLPHRGRLPRPPAPCAPRPRVRACLHAAGLAWALALLGAPGAWAAPPGAAAQPAAVAEADRGRTDPAAARAVYTLPLIGAPDYWLRLDTGLHVSRGVLEEGWHGTAQPAGRGSDFALPSPAAARWSLAPPTGPTLLDRPATQLFSADPQHPLRPQIVLGSASDSLRSFLREAGLGASTCMAPLMKMHSTIDGSGPRTSVSVSAKCNFH